MRRLFLSIMCILLCSNIAFAQKRKSKKKKNESERFVSMMLSYGVKPIEINVDYLGNESWRYSFKQSNSINLGFSYQKIKSSNWFYEISLTGISIDKNDIVLILDFDDGPEPVYGNGNLRIEASSRFEYGKYLFSRSSNKNFNIGLSIGSEAYFLRTRIIPANTAWSAWRIFRVGAEFQVIPTLSFKPSNKFALDFKIIPSLVEVYRYKHRLDDPSLSLRQQIDKSFSTDFLNDVRFSLIARYNLY